MCCGCRLLLPFNFKRKHHNCYGCGLVFCHSCSSKKSLKASMAPNPHKPYRVCDNCFNNLRKAIEIDASSQSSMSRRGSINQGTGDFVDKDEKFDLRSRMQLARFSSTNFFSPSVPESRIVSRATSLISRRPSPPRSTTPTPTLWGLTSPKIFVDEAKKTNDSLSQEVIRLRAQVENLTRKAQLQEVELERTTKQLKEAIAIMAQDMAERLPVGAARSIKSTIRNGSRAKEGEFRNENEWVEQDEPGVYITLTALPGGGKDLKRVRFSRNRFSEKQAEQWWAENRTRVYEQYNVRVIEKSSVGVGSEDLAH